MSLVSPNHFVCKPPPEEDILLTRVEAAMYLRLSLPTLQRWGRLGIGPKPLRVGHSIRYRLSDVRSFPQAAMAA
jgi:hypothetical protein